MKTIIMQLTSYPANLYPFQSHWINIDGIRIHYIDEGTGPTLLFCHPPITSSFMYRGMIKALSQKCRCIAFDFPGYGLSDAGTNAIQTITTQAEMVEKFMAALQLKDIFLLMQEVGGHAAMMAFLENPQLLKALIITDTIPFPCTPYPQIGRMLRLVNGRFFNFFNANFNFLIWALTNFGIQKRKLSQGEKSVYKKLFDTKEKRRTATRLLYEIVAQEKLLTQIQWALETKFHQLPTLLIYGSKDPLTAMQIPQRIQEMLSHAVLHWIEGEAHFPHEGAPDEMSAIIMNWLESQ